MKDRIKEAKFADVAGCDEAVKELRRVVSGLVGADVYSMFHAELPKGVLLIGPPGTGKTHLARAVAGETGGSFDITSGSDFVEMLKLAWAPHAFATCLKKHARKLPKLRSRTSSSSMKLTPSAASVAAERVPAATANANRPSTRSWLRWTAWSTTKAS